MYFITMHEIQIRNWTDFEVQMTACTSKVIRDKTDDLNDSNGLVVTLKLTLIKMRLV